MKSLRFLSIEIPTAPSSDEVEAAKAKGVAPAPTGYSTLGLIGMAINQQPQGGFTVSDLRARGRIEDALEGAVATIKSGGTVETLLLEDADAATLQRCVQAARWPWRHNGLLAFIEAVEQMPTVKSVPPEGTPQA